MVLHFLLILFSFSAAAKPPVIKAPEKDTLKIGLLIQDSNSREARFAAELAIRQTNKSGGINGQPVKLAIRSMEGPWGTGSKQAVDLVFTEDVRAIVGSHDGRNAHLAEQVATKTQVPFISAWAGDPTLTQAFISWCYNIVPNSNQQAETLVEEICSHKNYRKVVVLNAASYDSKVAADWFLKVVKNNAPLLQTARFPYDESDFSSSQLVDKIKSVETDCIVLFGTPKTSLKIIESLRQAKLNRPVYCDFSALGEDETKHLELKDFEGVTLINPGFLTNTRGKVFSEAFENEYGWKPGAAAAFTYDGITILLDAIRKSGAERNQLNGFLQRTNYEGITGHITFDKYGNRQGCKGVVSVKDGMAKPVEK